MDQAILAQVTSRILFGAGAVALPSCLALPVSRLTPGKCLRHGARETMLSLQYKQVC